MWYLVHRNTDPTCQIWGGPCKLMLQWLDLSVLRLLQDTVSLSKCHQSLLCSSQEPGHIWPHSSIFNSNKKEQMSNIPAKDSNPCLTWRNIVATVVKCPVRCAHMELVQVWKCDRESEPDTDVLQLLVLYHCVVENWRSITLTNF